MGGSRNMNWIELTKTICNEPRPTLINLDRVTDIASIKGKTNLYFSENDAVTVNESYGEVKTIIERMVRGERG